jgi:hypothetical protein
MYYTFANETLFIGRGSCTLDCNDVDIVIEVEGMFILFFEDFIVVITSSFLVDFYNFISKICDLLLVIDYLEIVV